MTTQKFRKNSCESLPDNFARSRNFEVSERACAASYERPAARDGLQCVGAADCGLRDFSIFLPGTGAIGIEALSRGASEAVFIESHAPAAALIQQNLTSLGIRSGVSVLRVDAVRGLEKLASEAEGAVRSCLYRSAVCGRRSVCAGAGGGGEVAGVSCGVADCCRASASVCAARCCRADDSSAD